MAAPHAGELERALAQRHAMLGPPFMRWPGTVQTLVPWSISCTARVEGFAKPRRCQNRKFQGARNRAFLAP